MAKKKIVPRVSWSTKLPMICVRDDVTDDHLVNGLKRDKAYWLLGEPALTSGGTGHIVIIDPSSGTIFPGMYHEEIFRPVTEDDPFS